MIELPDSPAVISHLKPIAEPDECYEALTAASGAGQMRLYVGDDPLDESRLHESRRGYLKPDAAGSLTVSIPQYLRGLAMLLGTPEVGGIVNGFQTFHAEIAKRVGAFLAMLPNRGPATVLVDFFFGSYSRSFFKLHKDEMDIFAFPILGRKRYVLWPFEHFRDVIPNAGPAAAAHPKQRHEYSERSACVLESGDSCAVVYWPASYWHTAENAAGLGMPHASINIGVRWEQR